MRALRVQAEGLTTSFRYPHFLVGRQPTFRLPPPATIYGHICSAVGDFIDPRGVQFGYVFRYAGIGDDLELQHIAVVGTGKPRPDGHPRNIEATPTPVPREVLLTPQLTLYVTADDPLLDRLHLAFREPRYAVTLGRSQDLIAYRSVDLVDLVEAEGAYVEDTLLPWAYRLRTRDGIGVTMPRFIDPQDRQRVIWSPFLMLQGRIRTARPGEDNTPRRGILALLAADERWWADPASPPAHGFHRAVIWHSFLADGSDEHVFLATST